MLQPSGWLDRPAAQVDNPEGRAPVVLVCDHASNWVPAALLNLGLSVEDLDSHIAWDPGALAVAQQLAVLLDAPLVHATVSRLVLDVNRDPANPSSVTTMSESTPVPGNCNVSADDRARRVRDVYDVYHRLLASIITAQLARRALPTLVAIHSFTPVYRDQRRPWHVGVLSDTDRRLAQPLIEFLRKSGALEVGDNQPYAPSDGVYHTLARHSAPCGLQSVMIELRADLIDNAASQQRWARSLRDALNVSTLR